MKITRTLFSSVLLTAFSAVAATPMFSSGSTVDPQTLINRVRQRPMSESNQQFDSGLAFLKESAPQPGDISGLYFCDATTNSAAFNARFTFHPDKKTVTIENLGGFCAKAEYNFQPKEIEAKFEDGVITIPCSEVGAGSANATNLGVLKAYDMDVYLQVGRLDWTDDFMTYVDEPMSELKLYVSDDYSVIETRLEKNISVAGVIDYTDFFDVWAVSSACTGGMHFAKKEEGAAWKLSDTALDFGTTFVGTEVSRYVTVSSTGDADVEFATELSGGDFTVIPASGVITAGESQKLQVIFKPSTAGEANATLTVSGGEGSGVVTLTGVAEERATDFSVLISEGDASAVTWANTSDAPWRIVDGNAVFDNRTSNTESVLKATFSGNSVKSVSFDLNMRRSLSDYFKVKINGREVHSFQRDYTNTISCIVPGGNATVEFVVMSGNYPEGTLQLGNMKITNTKTWTGLSPDGECSTSHCRGNEEY